MPPGLYRVGHCSLEQKTKLNREWTRMDTNLDLIAAVAPDVFHLRISAACLAGANFGFLVGCSLAKADSSAVGRFVVALGTSGLQSLAGVLGSCVLQEPRVQLLILINIENTMVSPG